MKLKPIDLNEDISNSVFDTVACHQLQAMYKDFYPKIGFHLPWVGYYIILEDEVVGSCGFVGRPQEGKVEIAYWTFENFEGKGIASRACKELLRIAYEAEPHVKVTAKTAPEKNASVKILEKNGFVFSGIVQDEEIGNAWFWRHEKV